MGASDLDAADGSSMQAPAPAAAAVPSVAQLTAQAGGDPAPVTNDPPMPDHGDSGSNGASAGHGAKSGSGSAAWAKAFSFMKDTNNPVDGGGKKSVSDSTTSLSSNKHVDLFQKDEKSDKFLADLESLAVGGDVCALGCLDPVGEAHADPSPSSWWVVIRLT